MKDFFAIPERGVYINWAEIPEIYTHIAIDYIGRVYAYEGKPVWFLSEATWIGGRMYFICQICVCSNWRELIFERPSKLTIK